MPHITVEYSANIQERADIRGLIDKLHSAAIETGVFPAGGTRTRGERRDLYRIADGAADNGFVHVTLRVGHGRTLEVRRRAAEQLFAVLSAHLKPLFDAAPLAISAEMQEIDPQFSFKLNNLHSHLAQKPAAGA